ncbi:MAG: MATE family efflux transporter [Clostridia bacterium]|nr:MATE family efflux transporter [Clostridia bacterium]
MTQGAILPQLIRFSLPLMATSFLQLLYNAADMMVVGQFGGTEPLGAVASAGKQSLAAVGSTGALINLIVNLFVGFSLGANVVIAHAKGAQDRKGVQRNVHTAIPLALISGVILMFIGFFLARPLLQMMDSPHDVIDKATLYVKLFFLGMPANMLYNFGAGIMRAVGDTRRPLVYLGISGLANVLLNLLLVIVFRMDVAGVAIATVVSQVLSAFFVLWHLTHTDEDIRLDLKKMKLDKECVKEIVRVGLPAGIQSSLFSLSNVTIQRSINIQGSDWVAGNAAAANVEGFVWVSMNAISQGTLTFSSANRGAKEYARVRKVLWVSLITVVAVGLAISMVALLFGDTLLALYNGDSTVIEKGMVRMVIIMTTYWICGLMDVAGSQMRGMGYAISPMIVSLTGACAFRLVWVAMMTEGGLLARLLGMDLSVAENYMTTLYISYPISWALTFLAHLGCYFFLGRPKMIRQEKEMLRAAEQ